MGEDGKLYNAHLLLRRRKVAAARYKVDLPNYGVVRSRSGCFHPGQLAGADRLQGHTHRRHRVRGHLGPGRGRVHHRDRGEILLVPNGSPYWRDKTATRLNIAVARVVESGLPLVYLNMVRRAGRTDLRRRSFGLNADRFVRVPASGIFRKPS